MLRINPHNIIHPYSYPHNFITAVDFIIIKPNSHINVRRGFQSLVKNVSQEKRTPSEQNGQPATNDIKDTQSKFQKRISELQLENALNWPRIKKYPYTLTIRQFTEKWENLACEESADESESVCVRGKLMSCRVMGTRLIFMDIQQDSKKLQIMANLGILVKKSNVSENSFQRLYHIAHRGDYISVTGFAHRTRNGELSIMADSIPEIISPTLRSLPVSLSNPETRIRNRHVDFLINKRLQQTIRMRSHIIQYLRNFLLENKFIEVQTPLIADKASGAIAKPFITTSTVISNKELALRVAPELWLKRLIIGGFDRVFEIGPAFRNEGFDQIHNPEFTICEFYQAFASLKELIEMTESLFFGLARAAQSLQKNYLVDLPEIDTSAFELPFRRIKFIPAIESALGEKLPDLASHNAEKEIHNLFLRHKIKICSSTSLPCLLDKLSALYIEPLCTGPTVITNHPACMAPLAKSFLDPECNQFVSARAEIFVNHQELANMYEEENSPIEQRKKFKEQANFRDIENDRHVDESYLSALEWGLPPTGGWGCGIDRLAMLFTGAERIQEVLSFGSLKNVVSLGNFSNSDKN